MGLFHHRDNYRKTWHKQNMHNGTWAENHFDARKVIIGRGTYGPLCVYTSGTDDSKLKIGNFCSIGPNVQFILASEHPYNRVSTFPFRVKFGLQKFEATSKGDIVVDDDVWIGASAIINSGVHIGRGAIIASGAVVVKDVEPFAIVGGNPARLIKFRFPKKIRDLLIKIDWNAVSDDFIKTNIGLFYTTLTNNNISAIISAIKNYKE